MRTCVTPSTDCSHREWASLLSWSLSAPLPVLPLLCCWKGAFKPPLTCPFSPPENWNKVVSCQGGAGVPSGFWGEH